MPLLSGSERTASMLGWRGARPGFTGDVRMADACGPVPVIALRAATNSIGNPPPPDPLRQFPDQTRGQFVIVYRPAPFLIISDRLVDDGRVVVAVERRREQLRRGGREAEMKSPDEWFAA